jgi:peptidoglycan-associated lipoprotein
MKRFLYCVVAILTATSLTACSSKKAPQAPPPSPPSVFPGSVTNPTNTPVTPPPMPPEPPIISSADPTIKSTDTRSIEEINKNSPLKPVFFSYDSDALDDAGRRILSENAQVLKANPNWVITVEGHCDERGTAEYNLALGDRRALAAKSYLLSLGVGADRLKTVSYGKEFPFDPGHDEDSWSQNRRAHFMLTSK